MLLAGLLWSRGTSSWADMLKLTKYLADFVLAAFLVLCKYFRAVVSLSRSGIVSVFDVARRGTVVICRHMYF